MTSLGNYASASVLSCNSLLCNNITAVTLNPKNTLTQVYGKFDLSQNTSVNGTLTTIGNWQPTSILKNVAVLPDDGAQGNAKFVVTQVGLYEVTTNLEIDNGANEILSVESRVVLYPSTSVAGGAVTTFGGATTWRKNTQINIVQFEITDPTTQYFEIEGKCAFTGTIPTYQTTYTHVFIRKIV
tara:strand:+ start:5292 stop:5843 length:552 start_codon:yes stop_codon:yes gene_type:complete